MDHRVRATPQECGDRYGENGEMLYQLKPGYAIRAFMDEYLVIPVGSPGSDDSKMAVLSPVAEFIWSLLEEPHTLGELIKAVTNDFEVSDDVAEPDIREFLRELETNGFLLCIPCDAPTAFATKTKKTEQFKEKET